VEVDIDQAGEDGEAPRVDLLAPGGQLGADGGDVTLLHRYIVGRATGDDAVADYEIMHEGAPVRRREERSLTVAAQIGRSTGALE
jgi:hypothetical protein